MSTHYLLVLEHPDSNMRWFYHFEALAPHDIMLIERAYVLSLGDKRDWIPLLDIVLPITAQADRDAFVRKHLPELTDLSFARARKIKPHLLPQLDGLSLRVRCFDELE